MALGPKAMGEAIAHNLKTKTGKTLEEWLAALDGAGAADRATSLAWLKEQGLGHFQAQLVVDRREGQPLYDDRDGLVDSLFARHPEQRALYEQVAAEAQEQHDLTANPCKGYVPLYSPRKRIVVSFTPRTRGSTSASSATPSHFRSSPTGRPSAARSA
ncbi:DUF4287 domain-containing protein [Microbacterium sp. NIBRBAC000506063]|uniref:DUF4287 domain-containing protein n=1 Tax=Microbacterium sp. NIBRBAC000506063 TaxID=2734618 RepID=UPI001BB784CE|nr:DUF4287 domain-containing protein [Microbacterium sp. NIBRBAC000506063]QTV79788.1 DUF4287 domain-containing protein [Microbacterium sp. NIBRBAC000506063]